MTDEPALFLRTLTGLQPDNEAAREALQTLPVGSLVKCDVKRPRNLPQLRLFWSLCRAIGDAVGAHRENVADVIKLKTGHFTVVKTASGLHKFPKSISFAKLSQAEFNVFMNEACRIVCAEFLPHMKADEIRAQIEQMVGIPVEKAA